MTDSSGATVSPPWGTFALCTFCCRCVLAGLPPPVTYAGRTQVGGRLQAHGGHGVCEEEQRRQGASRRRGFCHFDHTPCTFSRCFSRDTEGGGAVKMTELSPAATKVLDSDAVCAAVDASVCCEITETAQAASALLVAIAR